MCQGMEIEVHRMGERQSEMERFVCNRMSAFIKSDFEVSASIYFNIVLNFRHNFNWNWNSLNMFIYKHPLITERVRTD